MELTWLWGAFVLVMGVMMALDLGVLQKKSHAMTIREAALMTGVWWMLALAFCGAVAWAYGSEKAMLFLSGYILEQSLSVDNLFVFIMVFHYFNISPEHQPRILHWGIIGAIVMRFIFIFAGLSLLEASHAMIYVFGGILLYTGGKMLFSKEEGHSDPDKNTALVLLRKFVPVTKSPHGSTFFTTIDGKLHATPLFAALIVIEATDLVFAVDSIPAALGITRDLFVVYTSNIFAVMGLRSMYFLLAGSMQEFRHLKTAVSIVLVFVGAKMMVSGYYHVPTGVSLAVITSLLGGAILISLLERRFKKR